MSCFRLLRTCFGPLALVPAICLLPACGGGGGSPVSTPAPAPSPTPSPTPTPTPSPTPTPPASFDTAEYRRSDGAAVHHAVSAWQAGASGAGVTIGILDTGIDSDSPEFAGRISPDSRAFAGNATIEAADDHGTAVALLAAAARDDTGIVGIAYEAELLVLRTDEAGSCGTPGDCSFSDNDIALAIDHATASGARVINISLAGGPANNAVLDAARRAAAAGVIIVIAGGNDGETSDPSLDPSQPDPFARNLVDVAGGHVIIAGSVDLDGQFSSFSNRAGNYGSAFLSAAGEGLCCAYEDGVMKVETIDGTQYVYTFNGTSFAAPQISGAVALLAQAFPNLTGAQIVQLLLDTALDAGAAGPDTVYGAGILDIAEAFAPQGMVTLAGRAAALPLGDDIAVASPAMGDALGLASLPVVVTDSYRRAYQVDLGHRLRGAQPAQRLFGAVGRLSRQERFEGAAASVAVSIDGRAAAGRGAWTGPLRISREESEQARVLAARVALRLSPGSRLGFAYAESAQGLVAQLQGQERAAFLVAGSGESDDGAFRQADASFAFRRNLGGLGLTISAESGELVSAAPMQRASDLRLRRQRDRYDAFGLALDRGFGPVTASLGLTWQREAKTVLGARFHEALGARGADSLFADARLGWALASNLRFGAAWQQGWTRAAAGPVIRDGSQASTNGWSLDLTRSGGVFGAADSLALRISQPLRVEGGVLQLSLPAAYSYVTERPAPALQRLNLAPDGREITGELAWRGPLWGGAAAASLFYRRDPGHYASLPDDGGAALTWSAEF